MAFTGGIMGRHEADVGDRRERVDLSRSAASGLAPVSDLPTADSRRPGEIARKQSLVNCSLDMRRT
jgi:hypothetical protein